MARGRKPKVNKILFIDVISDMAILQTDAEQFELVRLSNKDLIEKSNNPILLYLVMLQKQEQDYEIRMMDEKEIRK